MMLGGVVEGQDHLLHPHLVPDLKFTKGHLVGTRTWVPGGLRQMLGVLQWEQNTKAREAHHQGQDREATRISSGLEDLHLGVLLGPTLDIPTITHS